MVESRGQPVCAREALNLLNCVTQSPFDQEKCLHLLHSLRECILIKKVKTLDYKEQKDANSVSKKA